jgi:hypothetical protein
MATKKPTTVTELSLDVVDTVDETERAALDAVRRFVESVDRAIPGGGTKSLPSRRVEIIDAALKMIEQLLGVSNEFAQRLTESVQGALPVKKAPAKKAPAKKAPAKKAPAKKAPAKKA